LTAKSDGLIYDIAFIGHYTKDTIVSSTGIRIVNGGAFFYGASVAARMGLKTAAVTKMAEEDRAVVSELENLGVDVRAEITPASTCLRLEYPSDDPDRRTISVTSRAGSFALDDVKPVAARCFVVGASTRGEISLEVMEELAAKDARIAVDAQGFIRVVRGGVLVNDEWPEATRVLSGVDVLKADRIEAESLTGFADIHRAARRLSEYGPSEVVLTHRDGVLVYTEGGFYEAGFYPEKLIGRSGRGDTCIASYAAKRLSSPPAEAAVWAAAVTSLKMETEGPFRRGMGEVEQLVRRRYAF
jgi:sugar/nucleoside kinase (ribokinase family)